MGIGVVLWFDGLVTVIGALFIARAKMRKQKSEFQEGHSDNLFTISIWVAGIVFGLSFLFVNPFLQFKRKADESTRANDSLTVVSNELKEVRAELTKSERARLAKLETRDISDLKKTQITPDPGTNTIAAIKTMMADNYKISIAAITSSVPALAMLANIATIPTNPVITDGSIKLQTLTEEQRNIEAEKKMSEARQQASDAIQRIYVAQSNALAYAIFRSAIDSFVRTFTNDLSILASQVGDRVNSSYSDLPALLTTNILINYASVKLESNAVWNFRLSLYADNNTQFIALIQPTTPNVPTVTISYDKYTQDPHWRKTPFIFQLDGESPPQRSSVENAPLEIDRLLRSFLRVQHYRFPMTNTIPGK